VRSTKYHRDLDEFGKVFLCRTKLVRIIGSLKAHQFQALFTGLFYFSFDISVTQLTRFGEFFFVFGKIPKNLSVCPFSFLFSRASKIETRENSGIYDSIVFRIRFKFLMNMDNP
jgi:hypothetical protein